jgi:hypothetical protein
LAGCHHCAPAPGPRLAREAVIGPVSGRRFPRVRRRAHHSLNLTRDSAKQEGSVTLSDLLLEVGDPPPLCRRRSIPPLRRHSAVAGPFGEPLLLGLRRLFGRIAARRRHFDRRAGDGGGDVDATTSTIRLAELLVLDLRWRSLNLTSVSARAVAVRRSSVRMTTPSPSAGMTIPRHLRSARGA